MMARIDIYPTRPWVVAADDRDVWRRLNQWWDAEGRAAFLVWLTAAGEDHGQIVPDDPEALA
jgi:hypothetical protein